MKLEDKVHIIGVGFDGWKNCTDCGNGFWALSDKQTECPKCQDDLVAFIGNLRRNA